MATIAIARRAPARRLIVSEHRIIRCNAKPLCIHAKHASSVQPVSNKAETIREALRGSSPSTMKKQAVAEIRAAWRKSEKYNLEFGKVCCEWRDKFKQKKTGPQSKGTGFILILKKTGVPISTAYWWMERYEVSIGAKPEKQKPEAPSPWTPDNEKRANRSEPIARMDGYKILAKKMLEAGFCELLKKKAADQSHLWAAKDWAKLRLDLGDAL
jgi:hypothetical protein